MVEEVNEQKPGTVATNDVVSKVWPLAEAAAKQNGCELYDVEFNSRNLRIFIDKEGGVSLDHCENVSRALNLHLDNMDLIPGGHYTLEVSSPGLDRHLRRPEHFQSAVGKEVTLRSHRALNEKGQKQFSGVIEKVENGEIELVTNEGKILIPVSDIQKAKLVFNFAKNLKKK